MALPIFDQSCSVSRPVRIFVESTRASDGEDALRELLVAHLQREEQHRQGLLDGDVGGQPERERGVVHDDVGGHEVVEAGHREVVDLLLALVGDLDDLVPAARRCRPDGAGPTQRAARPPPTASAAGRDQRPHRHAELRGVDAGRRRAAQRPSREHVHDGSPAHAARSAPERASHHAEAQQQVLDVAGEARRSGPRRRRARAGTAGRRGCRASSRSRNGSELVARQAEHGRRHMRGRRRRRPRGRGGAAGRARRVRRPARAARPRPCARSSWCRRPPSPRRWASTASSLPGSRLDAEPRQPPRHRDAVAWTQLGRAGRQPSGGEERVAERGAHGAARGRCGPGTPA